MIVITFGTFDLFHIGHLKILQRCKQMGDKLIVGVSSDELNFSKKNKYPVYDLEQRMAILKSIKYVDEVFIEDSLEKKADYIKEKSADILVMGDDWQGRFDYLSNICKVVYLPRTPTISTSYIIEVIKADK